MLIEHVLQAVEAEGREGLQIEALALQALAHWRHGERAGALTSLERALRLAEPEGYVRLFADLGMPMAQLLHQARSRAVLPDYVGKLLAAVGADLISPIPTEQTLPEPLSVREQEILELLAAGLTNREIGRRLFITQKTVGTHVAHIFQKLDVHTRLEAAGRAQQLGVLERSR